MLLIAVITGDADFLLLTKFIIARVILVKENVAIVIVIISWSALLTSDATVIFRE